MLRNPDLEGKPDIASKEVKQPRDWLGGKSRKVSQNPCHLD